MDDVDFKRGHKVELPLLVVWGARSHTGRVYGDALAIWRNYASNVSGGPIDCGHYVPEEAPDETLKWLLGHFA
jgi:haloacetate dehalogenase